MESSGKQRSPNYPSVDLGTAVENVKVLFKKIQRRRVPIDSAVEPLGFRSLSGPARSRVAALRQYGLVENDREGQIGLSHRGLTLALGSDSPEYDRALREAALAPEIFRELYQSRRHASDDNLWRYLILERKFSDDGAKRLVDAFRATLVFANLDGSSYEEDDLGGGESRMGEPRAVATPTISLDSQSAPRESPLVVDLKSSNERTQTWLLTDNKVAQFTVIGGEMEPEDVDLMRDYLDVLKKVLLRRKPVQSNSPVSLSPGESGLMSRADAQTDQ